MLDRGRSTITWIEQAVFVIGVDVALMLVALCWPGRPAARGTSSPAAASGQKEQGQYG